MRSAIVVLAIMVVWLIPAAFAGYRMRKRAERSFDAMMHAHGDVAGQGR
jgi:hypothetical protein